MMQVIDTHSHLNFDRYDKDRKQVIQTAFKNDVKYIINIGTDKVTSEQSLALAHQYKKIFATAGWHPHDADKYCEEDLLELLDKDKIVAVGEIGLDYYRNLSPRKMQKEVFARQIEVAKQYDLPIVVHDRDAHADVMEILKKHSPEKVVFHCYAGDYDMMQEVVEQGWFLSFTGVVTFDKNKYFHILQDIPEDRFFVETDAPYLTPKPYRGKRNRPEYVKHIIEFISMIRGESPNKIAEKTTANAEEFFNLP